MRCLPARVCINWSAPAIVEFNGQADVNMAYPWWRNTKVLSNLGGRPLARRARLSWPQERRQASEVVVRRVDPGRGWTLEQARDLLRQGYSVEHVAERTGFPEQMLKVAEED
ncbi:hypothetical protein ThrDRAFT_03532 [Frankia casuarinae]|jgi:hypothetical protein|nr:hypothetical protein CcI6DRAFT_03305 [Frankia sp. CcI6]EYT90821.1 hypothetical protein ThrDRAFT_03532 [Frankia casuarinae]KDA42049.1 hypothetical protein BMG523Draft_03165 [Frankia sp. BMG5.23]KFB06285.1 hypothetical protein ALLO2DRAFT_00812 [Frankia sp. Allo2]